MMAACNFITTLARAGRCQQESKSLVDSVHGNKDMSHCRIDSVTSVKNEKITKIMLPLAAAVAI
jgi:hypothetical protein